MISNQNLLNFSVQGTLKLKTLAPRSFSHPELKRARPPLKFKSPKLHSMPKVS